MLRMCDVLIWREIFLLTANRLSRNYVLQESLDNLKISTYEVFMSLPSECKFCSHANHHEFDYGHPIGNTKFL